MIRPAHHRLAGGMALALILGGCSLAPDYRRPDAPIAAAWPAGPAYEGAAENRAGPPAADIGWQECFTDPLLRELIGLSLRNNRDLRVAALNVQAASALYRIQRSELLPAIGAGADATMQRTPADLSPSGHATTSHRYSVGVGMTAFELDLFGRLRSLRDQALESYFAQRETRTSVQLSLVAEVANAYLSLRAHQQLLALTQDMLDSQRESYELTRQSYDHDVATALDLSQAEISVRAAERDMEIYSRAAAQDLNALRQLAGGPLPDALAASLAAPGELPDASVLADLPAGLPSDLLARRPDVRAAEHELRAANANIGAARAAFFPIISLTGSAGTASSSLSGLFKAGSGAWSFVPQITLPIFSGGANQANLDLAKVEKNIQVARYEAAIQAAFREVADALAARATLDRQVQAQQALETASGRAYRLAQQRYRQGIDNYLAVLVAQREWMAAQQALVETRLARLANLATLYKALGGGWAEHTVDAPAAGPAGPAGSAESAESAGPAGPAGSAEPAAVTG